MTSHCKVDQAVTARLIVGEPDRLWIVPVMQTEPCHQYPLMSRCRLSSPSLLSHHQQAPALQESHRRQLAEGQAVARQQSLQKARNPMAVASCCATERSIRKEEADEGADQMECMHRSSEAERAKPQKRAPVPAFAKPDDGAVSGAALDVALPPHLL